MPKAKSPRQAGIYTLADPETGAVRYIGATKDAHDRKRRHLAHGSNKGTRPVMGWLRSLFAKGQQPVFTLVEETTDLDAREQHWVAKLRVAGADLLNGNAGGRDSSHLNRSPNSHVARGKKTDLHRCMAEMSSDLKWAKKTGRKDLVERIEQTQKGVRLARTILKKKLGSISAANAYINHLMGEARHGQ